MIDNKKHIYHVIIGLMILIGIQGRISKCRTLKKHTLAEVENPAEGRTPDVGFIRNLAFIVLHYFI
ncbi:MAG: hypothetical protein ACJAWV_004273 [Flammeovirgaceae bacterium]|jgi:hypothetical protein